MGLIGEAYEENTDRNLGSGCRQERFLYAEFPRGVTDFSQTVTNRTALLNFER